MGIFLLDVNKHLWLSVIRGIFALIDSVVYTLIQILFGCMFNLANFELYGLYEVFEKRIYIILGLFMLFKVVTSMLSYLVSPDKINDKQEGASKLVTRIMISLVMLIMLPTFFSLMTEFQNKALPVIPRVIIGTTGTLNNENVSGVSQSMSSTMLQGFFHLKTEMGCTGTDINDVGDILLHVNDTCSGNNSIYAYDYLPIVSTIVGAAMCYVLFSLCISVAIRAFKLIILRMIAPIPVVSYISPKSSKDGMFATWTKTFISTWAEMFIYLGLIYFIVYIIDFLLSKNAWQGFFNGISDPFSGILLLAFLIIGLLFFARQAPKFIFDALGIKNQGGFGKMLSYGAAAIGAYGSARSSYNASRAADDELKRSHNALRNVGAGLFGGIAGGIAGGTAIANAKEHHLRAAYDAINSRNATALQAGYAGSTLKGRARSLVSRFFTGDTPATVEKREIAKMTKDIADMEAQKSILSAIDARVKGEMVKKDWTWGNLGLKDATGKDLELKANYKSFMAAYDTAVSEGRDSFEVYLKDKTGAIHKHEISMETANLQKGFLMKTNENDYYEQVYSGSQKDTVLSGQIQEARDQHVNEKYITNGRDGYKDGQDNLTKDITAAKRTKTERERANEINTANDSFAGNKK